MERLGLGYEALRARNPRLVYCSLSGYGLTGPLASRAGHDLTYLARCGVLGLQGPPDGPPQVPSTQMADIGGALWSVVAILAALHERSRTGVGARVDVSLMESSMAFAAAELGQMLAGGTLRRGDELLTGGLAVYATYATKDGRYVALAALEPKFWRAFCAGIGREADLEALAPGPHQAAWKEELTRVFRSRTRAEWEAFGRVHDCCLEPVLEPEELRDDEQLKARGVFFETESAWGRIGQVRLPVGERDGREDAPPPRRGEHTVEVLREGGFGEAEIEEMKAAGVLGV
jgi:crotonobetainyl-CoA:carnitine CoA-transferase CaiB-like acyl-CoA transferase